MRYIRTNIYITAKQKTATKQKAKRIGIRFSEAVRTALREWTKETQDA